MKVIIFLTGIIIIIALIWLIPVIRKWQRRNLTKKPFPLTWVSILDRNIPIYEKLTEEERHRLHGHIIILLKEKQFIGCGGLTITEEMKLIIAAQAALLLLNERGEYYSKLDSILVYPDTFIVKQKTPFGSNYLEGEQMVRGESWGHQGLVILSWEDIKRDSRNWKDGHNVIIHEFAHQLDQENGSTDGVPILEKQSDYGKWARVFSQEYHQLCWDIEAGKRTVINEYGATNPAEFFAVATETFFEKPQKMEQKHPQLYEELKRYYKLNPKNWI